MSLPFKIFISITSDRAHGNAAPAAMLGPFGKPNDCPQLCIIGTLSPESSSAVSDDEILEALLPIMQAVKDSEALRKAVEEVQPLQVKFGLRLSQSRPLYEGFRYACAPALHIMWLGLSMQACVRRAK